MYRVTGVLRTWAGEKRAMRFIVAVLRPTTPAEIADAVLAHLHAEPGAPRWAWAAPPVVAVAGPDEPGPGQWLLPQDLPTDMAAFLTPPPGANPTTALSILVSGWSASSSTAHAPDRVVSPRWEFLLDTSGPLEGQVPTSDATRTATARHALLRLLEHIGEWIVQLSDLLETPSPNQPTVDELARR